MSQVIQSRRLRAVDIGKRKAEGRKIVSLTAYHAHTAGIVARVAARLTAAAVCRRPVAS